MAYTVKHNADLSSRHTFRLQGCSCACLVDYDSADDLPEIFADRTLPRPILPVGGGSNIFFNGRFTGTILHCTDRSITITGTSVTAGAGATLDDLCSITSAAGLWGAESLSGIPGEIGGAIVQNAGAYGAEIADIIETVSVYDIAGNMFSELGNSGCRFGYRTSRFKDTEPTQPQFIITGARLKMSADRIPHQTHRRVEVSPSSTPESVREAVIRLRDSKLPDPAVTGSAGSFFKNPVIDTATLQRIILAEHSDDIPSYPAGPGRVKLPAAWLIDRSGLKGTTHGGAAVWHKQPLVIVNADGTATPSDVNALARHITEQVYRRYGITLEREVIRIQ